jgi:hypothetical protein
MTRRMMMIAHIFFNLLLGAFNPMSSLLLDGVVDHVFV